MVSAIICHFRNHRINRRRVRHDGQYFRTHCTRCGKPLVRRPSGWFVTDTEAGAIDLSDDMKVEEQVGA